MDFPKKSASVFRGFLSIFLVFGAAVTLAQNVHDTTRPTQQMTEKQRVHRAKGMVRQLKYDQANLFHFFRVYQPDPIYTRKDPDVSDIENRDVSAHYQKLARVVANKNEEPEVRLAVLDLMHELYEKIYGAEEFHHFHGEAYERAEAKMSQSLLAAYLEAENGKFSKSLLALLAKSWGYELAKHIDVESKKQTLSEKKLARLLQLVAEAAQPTTRSGRAVVSFRSLLPLIESNVAHQNQMVRMAAIDAKGEVGKFDLQDRYLPKLFKMMDEPHTPEPVQVRLIQALAKIATDGNAKTGKVLASTLRGLGTESAAALDAIKTLNEKSYFRTQETELIESLKRHSYFSDQYGETFPILAELATGKLKDSHGAEIVEFLTEASLSNSPDDADIRRIMALKALSKIFKTLGKDASSLASEPLKQALIKNLSEADYILRALAARNLRRTGHAFADDPVVTNAVKQATNDKEEAVALEAMLAAYKMGLGLDKRLFPLALKKGALKSLSLIDPSDVPIEHTGDYIVKIGESYKAAEFLGSASDLYRRFESLLEDPDRVANALKGKLDSLPYPFVMELADTLYGRGKSPEAAIPVLVNNLKRTTNDRSRFGALYYFKKHPKASAAALPHLIPLLDEEGLVAERTHEIIREMGPLGAAAKEPLLKKLAEYSDQYSFREDDVKRTLNTLAGISSNPNHDLIDLLESQQSLVGIYAISVFSPKTELNEELVRGYLSNKELYDNALILTGKKVLPILDKILETEDNEPSANGWILKSRAREIREVLLLNGSPELANYIETGKGKNEAVALIEKGPLYSVERHLRDIAMLAQPELSARAYELLGYYAKNHFSIVAKKVLANGLLEVRPLPNAAAIRAHRHFNLTEDGVDTLMRLSLGDNVEAALARFAVLGNQKSKIVPRWLTESYEFELHDYFASKTDEHREYHAALLKGILSAIERQSDLENYDRSGTFVRGLVEKIKGEEPEIFELAEKIATKIERKEKRRKNESSN